MIESQSSVTTAAPSGAAVLSATAGPGGGQAVLAAISTPDVLVLAMAGGLPWAGAGQGCAIAVRPARLRPAKGWATVTAGATQPASSAAAAKASAAGTSAKKTTTTSSSSSTAASKTSGPLGFLNDSKLSVEEKLFQFMLYVADKYDKAIEKKLKEIAGKQDGSASTSKPSSSGGKGLLGGLLGGGGGGLLGGLLGGGKGKGGLLGGLGSMLSAGGVGGLLKGSGIQDLVTHVSGPVLAAGASALGFPMLAPVLLKAGPELTKGAFNLIDEATGGEKSASSSSSSTSSKSSGDPQIEQKDMLELQRLQDKQKEMFSLVSNMLRSMHETKMAVINNLRA